VKYEYSAAEDQRTREIRTQRLRCLSSPTGIGRQDLDRPVPIGCDNQGAIKLITSGVVKQKSKHIDVRYHHVHDEQTRGSVHFQYVTSEANPADLLTKPLAAPRHTQLLQLIDLSTNDPAAHPITHAQPSHLTQATKEGNDTGKEKGVGLWGEKGGAGKKA
jgi:hypothetical protein